MIFDLWSDLRYLNFEAFTKIPRPVFDEGGKKTDGSRDASRDGRNEKDVGQGEKTWSTIII